MTFVLSCSGWSLDKDLQIVHADVRMEVEGESIIEEPLCVDVGLPALVLSAQESVEPIRFLDPLEWRKMPFFCCGCGDPECRAFSFRISHRPDGQVELTELEERPGSEPRVLGSYLVDGEQYRSCVLTIAQDFLDYVEPLDYRPYLGDTVQLVKGMLAGLVNERGAREIIGETTGN